jgi:TPR repeat protein
MKKISIILSTLLIFLSTSARSDFNDGVVAYTMQDFDRAFPVFQSLAETSDHGMAQYWLGMMYLKGQGVEQDYENAGKWFRRAAEQSVPQAQYRLGNLYYQGNGLPKDYESAYIWFSVGASHKHELSTNAISKAENKLSAEEKREADKIISDYVKRFGPQENFDPSQPIRISNE